MHCWFLEVFAVGMNERCRHHGAFAAVLPHVPGADLQVAVFSGTSYV
jgi:hypothetical protein